MTMSNPSRLKQGRIDPMKLQPSFLAVFEAQTDQMQAADAQAELLKLICFTRSTGRLAEVALWQIEDMLDPRKNSFWRLELKQRRRGARRKIPSVVAEDIEIKFAIAISEGFSKKAAIGKLAQEYGISDAAVRGILRRYTESKKR
jgi:hypothetical protein